MEVLLLAPGETALPSHPQPGAAEPRVPRRRQPCFSGGHLHLRPARLLPPQLFCLQMFQRETSREPESRRLRPLQRLLRPPSPCLTSASSGRWRRRRDSSSKPRGPFIWVLRDLSGLLLSQTSFGPAEPSVRSSSPSLSAPGSAPSSSSRHRLPLRTASTRSCREAAMLTPPPRAPLCSSSPQTLASLAPTGGINRNPNNALINLW